MRWGLIWILNPHHSNYALGKITCASGRARRTVRLCSSLLRCAWLRVTANDFLFLLLLRSLRNSRNSPHCRLLPRAARQFFYLFWIFFSLEVRLVTKFTLDKATFLPGKIVRTPWPVSEKAFGLASAWFETLSILLAQASNVLFSGKKPSFQQCVSLQKSKKQGIVHEISEAPDAFSGLLALDVKFTLLQLHQRAGVFRV